MDTLFNNAPGFDQPLAVLKHCHDRIRKQLNTLDKLLQHLPTHGADDQAKQAATAVLRYFNEAAPLHHEDEEIDLLPTLEVAALGADAALLQEYLPLILKQHPTPPRCAAPAGKWATSCQRRECLGPCTARASPRGWQSPAAICGGPRRRCGCGVR